ncbi:hypothetical protein BBJK_00045 [Bifidobacterium bifidum LMG 13195]|uniref:Uncharacterized protein n=1 Tax=Bifidobacterium bifidum LMG 13195 TaxID=1207542 RepID=A0A286T9K3_BIFBI|nr:hypothetical protein BBJK_00045 [Bifidobacterium bifidum LMG 13195]
MPAGLGLFSIFVDRRRQPGREEGLPLPRHRDPAHRRRHYDAQVKVAEEKGTKKPAAIPVLEITEIQDLSSGATAGKTIDKD